MINASIAISIALRANLRLAGADSTAVGSLPNQLILENVVDANGERVAIGIEHVQNANGDEILVGRPDEGVAGYCGAADWCLVDIDHGQRDGGWR